MIFFQISIHRHHIPVGWHHKGPTLDFLCTYLHSRQTHICFMMLSILSGHHFLSIQPQMPAFRDPVGWKYFIHETCVKYLIPGKYYTRYSTSLSEWHPGYQIGCQWGKGRPSISRFADTYGLLPIITHVIFHKLTRSPTQTDRQGQGWWVMASDGPISVEYKQHDTPKSYTIYLLY